MRSASKATKMMAKRMIKSQGKKLIASETKYRAISKKSFAIFTSVIDSPVRSASSNTQGTASEPRKMARQANKTLNKMAIRKGHRIRRTRARKIQQRPGLSMFDRCWTQDVLMKKKDKCLKQPTATY